MDAPVQGTPEPQGGESGGVFDSYLQSVPEDNRGVVAEYLKDAERNVNSRLQEAAEYRKQWEPYEQMGLSQYPQDQLTDLLAWYGQVSQDPDQFREWWQQIGQAQGLLNAEQQELEEFQELSPEVLEQKINERLTPLQQKLEEFEQAQLVDQESVGIRSALDALHKEHGDFDEEAVLELGVHDEGDNWIQNGFDKYQRIVSGAQRQFVTQKTGQPDTPLQGRSQQPAFKPASTFAEAREQALERLRQGQAA